MPLPAAFQPLRHPNFRLLWTATLFSNMGLWVQNTGAGWLMTILDGRPGMVALVQTASLLPVFLLAMPAGALADILDRRRFLIGAQLWMCFSALLLCLLAALGAIGPWGLLALTFALGIGSAINFPAFSAVTPELVPRADLAQAIVLNGIGFNLARALGPALGGLLMGMAGPQATFALNAACVMVLVVALFLWRRQAPAGRLPNEHFLSAMRTGVRFVVASPALRGTILRSLVTFFAGAAIWGLLPLLVRRQLGLGPEAYGLMLAAMGTGAVCAGFLLPSLRSRMSFSTLVVLGTTAMGAALVVLGLSRHWLPAILAMLVYGACWISAASTFGASAQLSAPSWVRARAMGLYQVATFGAMALGSVLSGAAGEAFGIPATLAGFGIGGAIGAWALQRLPMENPPPPPPPGADILHPAPESPDPGLASVLARDALPVMESVRYLVPEVDRAEFLAAMREVRGVRMRAGAVNWRLYEDVAHPERFVELWTMESWMEHLREAGRMTDADAAILARAAALHRGSEPALAGRYLSLEP
ncbi:MFS transporter [Roseomonas gilardii]|uniref:MFS transporter n=1 Tax=Roseomonas gilardii TaxID=257708 RepID=A0ABU3M9W8_9PROT|nr:MFS transporter [Roseomonas gilardii]MDT8329691.1 MFS transporter [Roseomonas gilardii]